MPLTGSFQDDRLRASMNLILFVFACALAGLAALFGRGVDGFRRDSALSFVPSIGLIAVAIVAAQWLPPELRTPARVSFASGVILAAASSLLNRGVILSSALGVVACAAVSVVSSHHFPAVVEAAIAGSGLSLLLIRQPAAATTIAVFTSLTLANSLGVKTGSIEAGMRTGTIVGIVTLIFLLLGQVAKRKNFGEWSDWLVGTLISAAGYALGKFWLQETGAANAILLGGVTGLVVHGVTKEDGPLDSFRTVQCGLLWVGLASLGFGLAHGFGMSLSLATGVLLLAGLGNWKGVLTSGPLLGLVLYRSFREAHVEASRALDLGQHYALIGFMIAALLPLLPWNFFDREGNRLRLGFAALLAVAVAMAVPAVVPVLLAAKGAVGFVAGLGFAPLFAAKDERSSLSTYGFAAGLAGFAILAYTHLKELSELSRDDKSHLLVKIAIGLAVLLALIAVLVPRKAKEAVS